MSYGLRPPAARRAIALRLPTAPCGAEPPGLNQSDAAPARSLPAARPRDRAPARRRDRRRLPLRRRRLTDAALAPLIEAAFRRGGRRRWRWPSTPRRQPRAVEPDRRPHPPPRRREELPVHAFVEDTAASGGYWLATAADDIHVDANSIVGLDRRDLRLLRLPGADRPPRVSAGCTPPARTRACSTLPARAPRGRRAPEAAAGGDPRQLHRAGQGPPRRPARGDDLFTGEVWVGAGGGRARASPTGSATSCRRCGPATATRCASRHRPAPAAVPPARACRASARRSTRVEARAHWSRYGLTAP